MPFKNKMTSKNFCFCPVSGGYFVSQSAIISRILEARGKQMDAYFGASGGNIAAITALKFSKTRESMLRIISSVTPDFFVQKTILRGNLAKFDNILLGMLLYSGLKKEGTGATDFFKDIFSGEEFSDLPEIWTLMFNTKKKLGEVTCTRSKTATIFKDYINEVYLKRLGCAGVHYLDGDLDLLSKVSVASATLPGIRPSTKIGTGMFIDGGLCAATPGKFFIQNIKELMADNASDKLHYFYVTSCDLMNNDKLNTYVKEGVVKKSGEGYFLLEAATNIRSMAVSLIFSDKTIMFENWLEIIGKDVTEIIEERHNNITDSQLKLLIDTYETSHYFMELICYENCSVNILDFNKEDVIESFNKALSTMCIIIHRPIV